MKCGEASVFCPSAAAFSCPFRRPQKNEKSIRLCHLSFVIHHLSLSLDLGLGLSFVALGFRFKWYVWMSGTIWAMAVGEKTALRGRRRGETIRWLVNR